MTTPAARIRTLVLMGGPDAERDVSLMSGEQVAAALKQAADIDAIQFVVDRPTVAELAAHRPDVIFPVLHGPFGEGGPMQEILDSLSRSHHIGYVGCRPQAAAMAMDKVLTKALVSEVGVPTPRSRELTGDGDAADLELPLVIKPANEGSSVGLTICRTRADVDLARRDLVAKGRRVLAEEYINGRELTVGIVDGQTLPIIEIVPAVEFYDYDAKYHREDTRYVLEPGLPRGVAERLNAYTLTVWNRLGCRDIARADFMLDERGPWFLEINTMPGMTTHSLVPMAARHRGQSMTDLCAGLVRAAFVRERRPVEAGSGSRACSR